MHLGGEGGEQRRGEVGSGAYNIEPSFLFPPSRVAVQGVSATSSALFQAPGRRWPGEVGLKDC